MPNAMVPLQNITLSSPQSSVTFASIPGTFRDLYIITNTRHVSSNQPFNQLRYRFNSDSGANYNYVRMIGWGTNTESSGGSNNVELTFTFDAPSTSSSFVPIISNIMDYATNKHKSIIARLDDAAVSTQAYTARWASTAAITSVTIFAPSDSWVAGSTFALFGVVA